MIDLLIKGGFMMPALLACSVVAIGVVLDRLLAFRSYESIDNRSLRARVMEHIWNDEIEEAALLCAKTPGPVSAVLLAGIQAYAAGRERQEAGNTQMPLTVTVKEAMEDYSIQAISAVQKRFAILSTIGNAAPLMGMTGTVTGMIASFAALQDAANKAAVAQGISEALITTAAGLIIALIAVIPFNYFNSKSDEVDLEIEEVKSQFVETVAKVG